MSTHADESILLIDDDSFLLDMYAQKFKKCGAAVESSSDPHSALDKLRKGSKPSIILLDIMMPVMNGFDVLRTIKQENLAPQSCIIIMLTNQGQEEDVRMATSLGAGGYIIKASALPSEVCEKAFTIAQGIRTNHA